MLTALPLRLAYRAVFAGLFMTAGGAAHDRVLDDVAWLLLGTGMFLAGGVAQTALIHRRRLAAEWRRGVRTREAR